MCIYFYNRDFSSLAQVIHRKTYTSPCSARLCSPVLDLNKQKRLWDWTLHFHRYIQALNHNSSARYLHYQRKTLHLYFSPLSSAQNFYISSARIQIRTYLNILRSTRLCNTDNTKTMVVFYYTIIRAFNADKLITKYVILNDPPPGLFTFWDSVCGVSVTVLKTVPL